MGLDGSPMAETDRTPTVDMDGAIGFVVAHGDAVDRARLSWLRTGAAPPEEILTDAEMGGAPDGGWPAVWGTGVASIDATCFRLAELDDLGALDRPAARRALDWLAAGQRPDGTWEEDEALAREAPNWARPGDPEAELFLTASAGFWLTVAELDARAATRLDQPDQQAARPYATHVRAAAQAIAARLRPDGTWPSFLAAGWMSAAVLYHQEMFYESARIHGVLGDRLAEMSPADVAWMASALVRAGVNPDDWLLLAARRRLAETQRSDGGWPSEDGDTFDVHTALLVIRACR
ncbi:squalene--hopene cyclase [Micromonospora sp. NPDC050417]|uniref:squalene--hopene cyclase n=1 Tax=Micromonospora sp. NPDC050417 TaxID=3364280 RepID=UPI003797D5B7